MKIRKAYQNNSFVVEFNNESVSPMICWCMETFSNGKIVFSLDEYLKTSLKYNWIVILDRYEMENDESRNISMQILFKKTADTLVFKLKYSELF